MANSQNLAPSFCRFAWRMHERLSPERLSEEDKQRLFEIIHALLDAMNTGEVCVDLKRVTTPETFSSIKALLLRSRLAAEGEANDVLFVIDENDRLYLHRFYHYEVRLAQRLKALKDHRYSLEDEAFHLDLLFKLLKNEHGVDMQALAVAVAQTSALTVISGGPGTGKTTLAAFLCAMLYGLPATRKNDPAENERKKYLPWQGGVFGGSGMYLPIEDMIKLGILYLHDGVWSGQRLLSHEWVAMAGSKQIDTGNPDPWNSGYGFQFWMIGQQPGAFRCDGLYGQYSLILPKENAVIAMQGSEQNDVLKVIPLIQKYLIS